MVLYSDSPKETQKLAEKMAKKMRSGSPSHGFGRVNIIALEGELGAGKTTFVQAFVKALGITAKIKSPTFNIIKKYPVKLRHGAGKITKYVYHIDCYRLRDHKDALPVGIKEIFKEKDALVLIEWPERISKILPKKIIRVHIDHIAPSKRKITIKK